MTKRRESHGNGVSLLLLGPAQSGKSTFFRQLQLMHGNCFTTLQEKTTFRPIINENLVGSLHTLVTKMPMYQIALSHKGSEKVSFALFELPSLTLHSPHVFLGGEGKHYDI